MFMLLRSPRAKDLKKFDIFVHYAVAATDMALRHSGLEISDSNAHRVGVVIGSGIGGFPMIEKNNQALLEKGPRRVSPFFIPGMILNLASGNVSIRFGAKGPNLALATACATGTHASLYHQIGSTNTTTSVVGCKTSSRHGERKRRSGCMSR